MRPAQRSFFVALVVLAIASRLLWALWIHPPADFVIRDMRGYVAHAQYLVEHGLSPRRTMAFQAWGTQALLALPLALDKSLRLAAILWALLGASAVISIYCVALRVCTRRGLAEVVGIAALLWLPNIANVGVFLSEAPLVGLLTAAIWRLVVLIDEGRGALGCGLLCAACSALRPEVAVFLVMALVHGVRVRRGSQGFWRHIPLVATPVALVGAFSIWHFNHHTGRGVGVAESATINLTLARCHHPRIVAYDSREAFDEERGGHSVGIMSFGQRLALGNHGATALHPAFGLRPATFTIPGEPSPFPIKISRGGFRIQYVGDRSDPAIHRSIRRECLARTGLLGQLPISMVNLSGLVLGDQWPDNAERGEPFLPFSQLFAWVYRWFVGIPALVGMGLALRRARARPGLALCALPLLGLILIASIWFGEVRLRTPYDPLALLLAAEAYLSGYDALRHRLGRTRSAACERASEQASERATNRSPRS